MLQILGLGLVAIGLMAASFLCAYIAISLGIEGRIVGASRTLLVAGWGLCAGTLFGIAARLVGYIHTIAVR